MRQALLMATIPVASLLAATPANAAPQTWVAAAGNDAGACTRAAPCQTFAVAMNKTDAGGRIDCIDTGEFGPMLIVKTLTVSCAAGGGITTTQTAIQINAAPDDIVTLDGLVLTGVSNNVNFGIDFFNGGGLVLRNTSISGFQRGIYFNASNANATLNIDNCFFSKADKAVYVTPNYANSVRAVISDSKFTNNNVAVYAEGIYTLGSVFISINNTNIAGSSSHGIYTTAGKAAFSTVSLDEVRVSGGGGFGLSAEGAKAGFLVNNSTITNNRTGGLNPNGGVIYSYGNNRVNGNNGKDGSFTGTLQQR